MRYWRAWCSDVCPSDLLRPGRSRLLQSCSLADHARKIRVRTLSEAAALQKCGSTRPQALASSRFAGTEIGRATWRETGDGCVTASKQFRHGTTSKGGRN